LTPINYVQFHTCLINTPKFRQFKRKLGMFEWECIGILTALWRVTAEQAPDGVFTNWTVNKFAIACDWKEQIKNKIFSALVECGWLDREGDNYIVHDWAENQPAVQARKYNKGYYKKLRESKNSRLTKNFQENSDIEIKRNEAKKEYINDNPCTESTVGSEILQEFTLSMSSYALSLDNRWKLSPNMGLKLNSEFTSLANRFPALDRLINAGKEYLHFIRDNGKTPSWGGMLKSMEARLMGAGEEPCPPPIKKDARYWLIEAVKELDKRGEIKAERDASGEFYPWEHYRDTLPQGIFDKLKNEAKQIKNAETPASPTQL